MATVSMQRQHTEWSELSGSPLSGMAPSDAQWADRQKASQVAQESRYQPLPPSIPALKAAKRSSSDSLTAANSDSVTPSDSDAFVPSLPGVATVEDLRVPSSAMALPSVLAGSSWASASQYMGGSLRHDASSTGEFTRGMQQMASPAVDSLAASGRSRPEQDEYLMRLLQRPVLAAVISAAAAPALFKQDPARLGAPSAAALRTTEQTAAASSVAKPMVLAPAVVLPPAQPAAAAGLRGALGAAAFAELRGRVLQHQDTFLQQIFDLHRCVRRQRHLVAACEQPEALQRAVSALQLQPLPSRTPAALTPAVVAAPPAEVPQLAAPPALQLAHQFHGALPPNMAYGTPAMYAGVPPPSVDPMSSWFAHHYGAYARPAVPPQLQQHPSGSLDAANAAAAAAAHTAHQVAAAQQQGPAGQGGDAAGTSGLRWWQDPAAVFGPSAVPELLAKVTAMQSCGAPPPAQQRQAEADSHLSQQAKKIAARPDSTMPLKKRSRSTMTNDERTGQNSDAGNGSSRGARTELINGGTSASKRGKGKNGSPHARGFNNESISSGNCSGQHQSDGSDGGGSRASPAALQSAASVLLSFSDCR